MKRLLDVLLPPTVDGTLGGAAPPAYIFGAIAVISTVRSLIHLMAPDGGAGSIAGMDLSVPGAPGIVFAFGLWGSAQLVYAVIQLLVAFRYRSLVPLMYLLLAFEVLLRLLVGATKPASFLHTPPGAYGNYVMLPLALLMLAWSLGSAPSSGARVRGAAGDLT